MAGKRQFDETELLERAMSRFWRHGVSETTMSDLAEATGVARGSLYNAYASRDALLEAALEFYAERYREQAMEALLESDPKAAMRAFLRTHIDRMAAPSNPPGCLMTGVCMEQSDFSAPLARLIERNFEMTEQNLEQYFTDASLRGSLQPGLEPGPLARYFVGITRAMAVMHKAHRGDLGPVHDIADTSLKIFK